jgi:hypothetical protein
MKKIDYVAGVQFLESYGKHFEDFLQFELHKLRLMHEHKIEELSAALGDEQALIMKTDALEKKRITLFGKVTFEELIENAPEELRRHLQNILNLARTNIGLIREINDLLTVNANEHLKSIHRRTKEFEIYNDRGGVKVDYRKNNADFKV